MNQVLHCDWLLEWARWGQLIHLDYPSIHMVSIMPYNKSLIGQACLVKMAGYGSSFPDHGP